MIQQTQENPGIARAKRKRTFLLKLFSTVSQTGVYFLGSDVKQYRKLKGNGKKQGDSSKQ